MTKTKYQSCISGHTGQVHWFDWWDNSRVVTFRATGVILHNGKKLLLVPLVDFARLTESYDLHKNSETSLRRHSECLYSVSLKGKKALDSAKTRLDSPGSKLPNIPKVWIDGLTELERHPVEKIKYPWMLLDYLQASWPFYSVHAMTPAYLDSVWSIEDSRLDKAIDAAFGQGEKSLAQYEQDQEVQQHCRMLERRIATLEEQLDELRATVKRMGLLCL